MRKSLIALVFLAFCSFLVAQQSLDNVAVIKLVKAGSSDDLIASTISARRPEPTTTTANGLIALKTAGASDRVVLGDRTEVFRGRRRLQQPLLPRRRQSSPIPTNPASPHEAGIYILQRQSSGRVEDGDAWSRLSIRRAKTGGMFASAMTYGIAKIKTKAVLRGAHANARVSDPQPVFYFYFERAGCWFESCLYTFRWH